MKLKITINTVNINILNLSKVSSKEAVVNKIPYVLIFPVSM